MFLQFFDLKENPFNVTSDPDFLYLSDTHKEALEHLLYGIHERKGFIALTGDVGAGKTTVCKALINKLNHNVRTSFILDSNLPEAQLLRAILADFGIPPETKNKFDLISQLNEFLLQELSFGNNAVLILDEAQNIRTSTLETIRLLSNLETQKEKLLQIVLVGQPELRKKINSPNLVQLRQRLRVRYHMSPLRRDEVRKYIKHRLTVAGPTNKLFFREEAIDQVFNYSRGIPRLINLICDKSMLAAFSMESFEVDKHTVRGCVEELENHLTIGMRA